MSNDIDQCGIKRDFIAMKSSLFYAKCKESSRFSIFQWALESRDLLIHRLFLS
jgi:hypothetical protein